MKDRIKKITRSRIFTLFEILLFIVVCMGIGAAISYVEHESDPTEQAVGYFRAFVQKDYNKMFEYVELHEGYYVNQNIYKTEMKNLREKMIIDSYEIKDAETKNGVKQITIVCTDNESQKNQDFVIKFTEKREKLQIIPEYCVNIEDMFVDDISVVMRKDNYLELNGEKITDKEAEISTDKKGNITYAIKGALKGKYKVSATNEYSAAYKYVDITKPNTKVDLTNQTVTANDKYSKVLLGYGQKVIENFYAAVRNRKPDDKKLMECFDNNKKLRDEVKAAGQASGEIVYWTDVKNIDKYKVTDFDISELKSVIKYLPDKKAYELTYTYNYKYVASTDTALYNSYVYSFAGHCSSTMKLTYTLKDKKVVLTDMKLTNKNTKDNQQTEQ